MNIHMARRRRGLATVVTSAIMMTAVCIMGSTGVVWSQTSLNSQQLEMTSTVNDYVNRINEFMVFEYVYCDSDPCDSIVVVLTNVGDVTLDVSEIKINDKDSEFTKTTKISKGQIKSDKSISVVIDDPAFSSYDILDVIVKTTRDNIIQTTIST
ncbi:MAG: hypothetical protein K5790_03175 [Nitrosopumilus sp.]|uniref:hypothetical protein n=1 Tax=Nitrosopumilus sp. TaxID=2024843 RepID=UPI00247C597C|nr:hypothetical protein [Nitrosopumilus sp.]MCV0392279.1 hypothetical protein [Nitrosopumilus sp.]